MAERVIGVEFKGKTRGGNRGPRPRTEQQKGYDADVLDAFENDPNHVVAYQVTPDEAKAVHKGVASAARLHGLAVTQGESAPGRKKGTVVVQYRVRRPAKRGPRKPKA